jgi:hypothetical protein
MVAFPQLIAAALTLAVSTPALAQEKPRAADAPGLFTQPVATPEALAIMHQYADCLVDRRPKEVRSALALDFTSEAYETKIGNIARSRNSCMQSGRMQVAPVLLAGALAERAFNVDFGAQDHAKIWPGDWTKLPIAARTDGEAMMLCIVQRAPDAARALLLTPFGGEGEKAAQSAIVAQLPGCMKDGVSARLTRPYLRALVALAAYRSARHFAGENI